MMSDEDLVWISKQLVATLEAMDQQMTPAAAALVVEDLSGFPKDIVARALGRVRNEHTGRVTSKAILDRVEEVAGRPAANEAWAIAMNALDESTTLVWNNEICDAWAVARPIAEAGDMIGARMGFISAYERIVRNARESKVLPQSIVSIGWDKATTNPAIEKALALGHITPVQAEEHRVPALAAPVFDGRLLLTGRIEPAKDAPQAVKERLAELREELAGSHQADAERRHWQKIAERREWDARKAEAKRRVDDALAAQSKGAAA